MAYDEFRTETQMNALAVANADGTGARVVVSDGTHPSWSPDGSRLVFETNFTGLVETVNADGTGLRTLGPGFDAVWSPAGNRIAFNAGSPDAPQVSVENADGTGARVVPGVIARLDDWDPSGTRLLVSIGTAPTTLEVIDATSGARDGIVTTSAASAAASWQRPG